MSHYVPKNFSPALVDVMLERTRQDIKWGQQDHPDGTHAKAAVQHFGGTAEEFKWSYEAAVKMGDVHWADILAEEVAEAFEESHPDKLREELVQVAAVAVAWVEAIDRRRAEKYAVTEPPQQ